MEAIKIFVINLKQSKDRRTHVKNTLDPIGLKYEFIDAIDGNNISDLEYQGAQQRSKKFIEKFSYRKVFSRNEVGCALSHLKAYEKVVEGNFDYACILEDDFKITNIQNFKYILEKKNLVTLNRKAPFDFIFLYLNFSRSIPPFYPFFKLDKYDFFSRWGKVKLKPGLFLSKPCDPSMGGAVGYIVNRKACLAFLKEGLPVSKPSDILIPCAELLGLKQYFLKPLPITFLAGMKTTIPDRDFEDKEPIRPFRILLALAKFMLAKIGLVSLKNLVKMYKDYE